MPADFTALQVTLASNGTAYCLHTLLAAIDTTVPIRACEVRLSAVTTTNPILVGDKNISTTKYGAKIQGQTSALAEADRDVTFRHAKNTIQLKSIYLWALTTDNMKVNVCVWTS